jgi:Phosphotransferase enzyme family
MSGIAADAIARAGSTYAHGPEISKVARNPDIPIVRSAGVDASWLTRVFRAAGIEATVSAVEARRVGTGQVAESVRFNLAYEGDASGAPATVVGKFPSPDPISREAGVRFGNYVREVNFYRQFAPTAGIRTPRALYADVDPDSSEFVLIMEDLAPAVQGDQLADLPVDAAALVLEEAAKLHASHWGDDRLDQLPWFFESRTGPNILGAEAISGLWSGFRERYGARIAPHCVEIGEAVTAAYGRYKSGYEGPKCLVHNDFRPDNMMFGTAAGGYPVTVVDWQTLGYGCCMADVSYFLAGALSRDHRRAHEAELLRGYHRGLIGLGVSDYPFETLWRDYARYSFALFIMAFTAAMVVERTERGDHMFFAMLESGAAHVQDHDALRLL